MTITTTNIIPSSRLASIWLGILAHKAGGVAEGVRVEVKNDSKTEETNLHGAGLHALGTGAGVRWRDGTGDSADWQGSVPCAGV